MAIRPGVLAGALSTKKLRATALAAGVLLSLAACERGARLTASWTGADTGEAVLPLSATSCVAGELLLTAMSGDTGVLLLLKLPEAAGPGQLPVLSPMDYQQTRPASAITARWLDSTTVSGYRGARGTVQLSSDSPPAGRFNAVLQRQGDLQEVTLEGEFSASALTACPDSAS
jgi:hypothetical protein